MLTSKQRSYLKSLSNTLEPVSQIGKGGVTPEVTESIAEALEARELIKITVNNNCTDEPKEIAEMITGRTRSECVMVIGKKIILYKESKNKSIQLPK